MPQALLTIGELADRTGVATSALRYYDEIGLVRPARRESGRRLYTSSAVGLVGVVLLLREVGFALGDIRRLLRSGSTGRVWRDLAAKKLEDLDQQIAKAQVARTAIEHSLACPHDSILDCPTFWAVVASILDNKPLAEADPHTCP